MLTRAPPQKGSTWIHEKGETEHREQACSSSWISDGLPIATGSADGTGPQAFKNKHSYTTHWMRSPCWSHCSSILSQNNRVGFKEQHYRNTKHHCNNKFKAGMMQKAESHLLLRWDSFHLHNHYILNCTFTHLMLPHVSIWWNAFEINKKSPHNHCWWHLD